MSAIRRAALAGAVAVALATAPPTFAIGKVLGNYSYDDSGNISSIGPADDGLTNYYYYDSAGRLIRFARKASVAANAVSEETYEYDGYGNVTKLARGGVVDSVPVSGSTNRLTDATYDAAGNVQTYDGVTYRFDPVGTLTQKTGTWGDAFYIYTADDERIGIEGPDDTWRYTVRDLDHKVLREWSASSWNGLLGWVQDYVYRDGKLAAAVRPDTQGGARHFHLDHLGTPRLITGPAAQEYASNDYYPFGREITDPEREVIQNRFDTPEPMRFTGHERDFAGSFDAAPVDYMHARYYVPHSGRFLSVDPGRDWDVMQPQSWNLYAYVRNNPLGNVDPDGRATTIYIKRDTYTKDTITGSFSVTSDVVSDIVCGYTLEDRKAGDKGDKNPIEAGTYEAFVREDHDPDRVELKNVPNFTNVQIHIGNTKEDVKGCFAVGDSRAVDEVNNSGNTIKAILAVIEKDGTGEINVVVEGANTDDPEGTDTKSDETKAKQN